MKILLQRVWEVGDGWDDPISSDLAEKWKTWCQELPCLQSKGIPRKLFEPNKEIESLQLHGFSDASMKAYSGVVYLRVRYTDTSISVILICSRTHIAPLKPLTIPKLELCGALMVAKLMSSIAKDLNIPLQSLYAWTDSTITQCWINSTPSRLKVFVANRVQHINELVPAAQWRYVPSAVNPADVATRGVSPQRLLQQELWWDGPPWMLQSSDCWPAQPMMKPLKEALDVKHAVMIVVTPTIS